MDIANRSRIYVEPKASGKSIVQTLQKETGLNVREDKPPSKDKVARVQDIICFFRVRQGKFIKWEMERGIYTTISKISICKT